MAAGKATRYAARLRGGGSALPGLIAERVDPAFLTHTLAGLPEGIVVVSGTNGKTTTTKMLVAILRAHGKRVFTNPTGSNFTRGVISSMLGELTVRRSRLDADLAVVELDEAHALVFAATVPPTHALLLNVARDQLDRFAEIDYTAGLLSRLAEQTTTGLVLNRDDAFIARIADMVHAHAAGPPGGKSAGPQIRYFGVHPSIADRLPELAEQDVRFADAATPAPQDSDALLAPRDDRVFDIRCGSGDIGPIELHQRGLAAMINATAATAMAAMLLGPRFDAAATARALREVRPPFGRGEVIDVDGAPLELVLVKNPAGFTVALGTYGASPVATMIAINDDYADGRDVSWLYDVSFASLQTAGVALTSGMRAYDMALRLQYDDVATAAVEPDLEIALNRFLADHRGQPARIFCTYTAMMALRRMLAARYGLAEIGADPEAGR